MTLTYFTARSILETGFYLEKSENNGLFGDLKLGRYRQLIKSIEVCEYSRSRSFHDDKMLQDQASGERSGPIVLWFTCKWTIRFYLAIDNNYIHIYSGITDENREDVKWCVSTSSLEKRIRYAARNMFHSINTAQKEVLSPDEYSEAIKKLTGGKEQKLLLAAGKIDSFQYLKTSKNDSFQYLKTSKNDSFQYVKTGKNDSFQYVKTSKNVSL